MGPLIFVQLAPEHTKSFCQSLVGPVSWPLFFLGGQKVASLPTILQNEARARHFPSLRWTSLLSQRAAGIVKLPDLWGFHPEFPCGFRGWQGEEHGWNIYIYTKIGKQYKDMI